MMSESQEGREGPPYLVAAGVSLGILCLYIITIAPTTQFWDTSEYIAAAKVLGIPHPPGNPLFVLLGHVWAQLPLVEHYALRLNLFAAVTSAVSSGLLFLFAERFLRSMMPDAKLPRYAAALAGILVGATAFTVWHQSVVNEKVYTLSLLSISVILWLSTRWVDAEPGPARDKLLLVILFLLTLSSTNHAMGLLGAPAMVVFMLSAYLKEGVNAGEWAKWLLFCTIVITLIFLPEILKHGASRSTVYAIPIVAVGGVAVFAAMTGHWLLAVFAVMITVVGLSVNGFLPIRAGMFPPINEGEPTNWEALRAVLSRDQYQKGPLIPRQADLYWQYANYLQYFSWQFGRHMEPGIRNGLALLFGGLGIAGAVWHWMKDRANAVALTALMLTVSVLLVFYLDFKFGFSIRPQEDLLREVRERDYFFVASFQLWGVWAALGFGAIFCWGAQFFGDRLEGNRKWLAGSPALLLVLIPLVGNWESASRAHETMPRDIAVDILQSVEPYSILVTAGDNDTFPLWYVQEVEGLRQDVVIANLSLMNTDWHNRQIKRRISAPFDSTRAPELYWNKTWQLPTEEPLSLSFEELDALPPFHQIQARSAFVKGNLEAVLEPQVLERADLVMLQLIEDNLGERPIYISRTTGRFGDSKGLGPYLLGQGLVRKLMPEPIIETETIKLVSQLGWLDLEASETLLFDVYRHESVARERPYGWIDEPSETILTLYFIIYQSYAETLTILASDSTGSIVDSTTLDQITNASQIATGVYRNTSLYREDSR
jgi:hypothetical protein